ncbi:MAG: hypothetical protein EXQ81_03675 [Thermoleophilia bacterium]|nr:hypothetical protein [Thermoleophilia bacterium]
MEWEVGPGPRTFAALERRELSRDAESDSATLMVRIPPAWKSVDLGDEATTEIFVLEGDLVVNGEAVGCGGYISLPPIGVANALESRCGAQVLVWHSHRLPVAPEAALRVTSIWAEPWQEGRLKGLPYGRLFKVLRANDVLEGPVQGGEAGFLRLNQWLPGYVAPNEHRHEVWEELIFLHGDWLTLERGQVAAGSYLGNPPGWWHGPLASRFGALAFVHSNRALGVELRDIEGGVAFSESYLRSGSLLDRPEHQGATALEPFIDLVR